MRFAPHFHLEQVPNVIVDGEATPSSKLVLSHWPKSGSPKAFAADTSAEIVFRFLDSRTPLDVEVASNNHFDEDGLIGLFALLRPDLALPHREVLSDASRAGDFGTYRLRDAARLAFTIAAHVDPETSPLDRAIFALPYPRMAAALYEALLPRMPELLDLERQSKHWEPEDQLLSASEAAIAAGSITIEERPDLDLAIVRLPEASRGGRVHRFTQARSAVCHPMAIHNATGCYRVLLVQGQSYELQFRYETWVQYQTHRPPPRVDLGPLARALNDAEGTSCWTFDGVEGIAPRLHRSGGESRVPLSQFLSLLEEQLRAAQPAWDPYD